MLPTFPNWTRKVTADGIVLIPPEGISVGAIRFRERIRPLRSVKSIVAMISRHMPGVTIGQVGPLVQSSTAEGEYAGTITISGQTATGPLERTIGVIYGDDSYSQIDGFITSPARFEEFRELVRKLAYYSSLGLGTGRRRMFLYDPPPGWQGLSRRFSTEWYPSDFPKNAGTITVCHARSLPETLSSVLDRELHFAVTSKDDRAKGVLSTAELASNFGLKGKLVRKVKQQATGTAPTYYDIAWLQDDNYLYIFDLERKEEGRQDLQNLFLDVVKSTRPLPVPDPAARTTSGFMSHWGD